MLQRLEKSLYHLIQILCVSITQKFEYRVRVGKCYVKEK